MGNINMNEQARLLKTVRVFYGYTKGEMADKMGLTHKTYVKWESGGIEDWDKVYHRLGVLPIDIKKVWIVKFPEDSEIPDLTFNVDQ